MQLERSRYQSGSEPEILTVRFSDSITDGAGFMKSPKSEWLDLAKETALNLGIDMQIRKLGDGTLAAAFRTSDDCTALVTAMQPGWKLRLLEGLRYTIQTMQVALYRQDEEFASELGKLADEYHLDLSDLNALLLPEDEACGRHIDLYIEP